MSIVNVLWSSVRFTNLIRVQLDHYGCSHKTAIDMLKHIIYVWRRSDMSVKCIVGCGVTWSHPTAWYKSESKTISYCHDCETNHISSWGCILMTTGHNRWCWNALYTYDEDLLWAWSEWGVSIIIYSMMQARNQVNCLLPLPHLFQEHISGWNRILMTNGHSWRC